MSDSAATPSASNSLNVDPSELEKFQSLAAKWWDKTSEFRPLHEINPLRVEWINRLCPLAGKTVVDVGCGGGILAEAMAAKGANVTGIDLADKSLKVAQLHLLESGQKVRYEKIATEEFADREQGQYDVVTCLEMLEHVPDPQAIVDACTKLLKPGGWAFFSTLNRNPKSFLFAIVGAEYVLRLLPKGTHDYAKFIKPSELINGTRQAGLELKDSTGLIYNPITKVYSLKKSDLSVNYWIATHKPFI
jgi:2-polyprenyl-6-hydroxyphenyl methylase / 3-demethylubiquinone-9 3-methyltransferase